MKSTRLVTRAAAIAALAVAITAGGITVAPEPAQAASATYYVDNRSGSDCSDTGPGTSETAPWCTFTPAATLTLGAGESLLLARGAQWSQQLLITLQGSASQPATLGAYGSGEAPRILFNETGTGVVVRNSKNAVVEALDIGAKTAAGTSALSYGLMIEFVSGTGYTNVTVRNVSVHDSRQVGIFLRNTSNTTNAQTVVDGLTLSNIVTTHNAHGIVLTNQGTVSGTGTTPGTTGVNVFTNVLFDRILQTNDDNNNPPPAEVFQQIDAGCPDSLALMSAKGVVVRNSILNGSAGCRTNSGTAAIFVGNVANVLIANNMLVNTPNTMNPDMVAIDHESLTSNVVIAGNYFADNYGGAIEYLAIHGANDFSTGNVATSNVFIRNGVARAIPYPGGGAIAQVGSGVVTNATISDNLAYEPFGLLTAQLGGDVASYTSTNNIGIGSADDISHAAAQYGESGTPWGYERTAGSSWQSLPYDSGSARYSDADVSIDQFTLRPTAASAAGITWTAPSSGVVSLRGYPLAESGSASVAVTKNGTAVASGTAVPAGISVKADAVAVSAGDVLRFAVAAGGSPVSWAPAVAYTSKAASTDALGEWTFSVAGDTQGWTSSAPGVIHRGVAELTTSSGTTTMDSPAGLHLSAAASSNLRLRYYNGTSASQGRIYFTTSTTESFTTAKSVAFTINPKGTKDIVEGFQSITVPLVSNALWTGKIERIRIELTSAPGVFLIDSLQLTKPAASGWEFDTAGGWTANPNVNCATTGTASASPAIDVDNGSGTFAQHADINWSNTRMQKFTVGTPRLAQVDFWAYKTGSPAGCLYLRVVKITDSATNRGETLFTGAVPASSVSTSGGFVSIYPGLSGLDTSATYGIEVFNPYVVPGGGTYGLGYSDDASRPAAAFGEYYSVSNNGVWVGPETNRSLRFRTYTAATIATHNPTAGYVPVTVSGGILQGSGGYEPALLSSASLGISASSTRYIHIRMNNPDNRQVAYLLFTTAANPKFDEPADGTPVPEEVGGKGIVFSLIPGAAYHEYVLDMSTVHGWTGTIQQIKVQPNHRWSYRVGALTSTWSGKIDYIRLDSGATAAMAG